MANISLLEFNHNTPRPKTYGELAEWAACFWLYVSSGDRSVLPKGFERVQMRHHSAPDPLGKPKNRTNHIEAKEIPTISIISPGTGYMGKPALPKVWAIKLGIWDEQYEADMLKNHPKIYGEEKL